MDTVTLAKQEREKQGPWEVEVSYGEEGDLQKHFNNCVKNSDHKDFIPVDQFNVVHLPPGCRDNDIVNMVRALSDLTVRVSVKYVSERRHVTVTENDKPYPSYKDSERNMMRTGTGAVLKVDKCPNERDSSTTCTCQECANSSTPKTQFAKIYIRTARHVVYDELEAAYTTCHLFFDKGVSPKPLDCSGVLELSDWAFVRRGEEEDWCQMVHVTHDLNLADLLEKMSQDWVKLWKKVYTKHRQLESGWRESSSPSEYLREAWYNLTIIVSHPHGCSKRVSVGDWAGWVEEHGFTRTRYTTPTCPGSSGAPVFVMKDGGFRTVGHVHCGNYEDNNLNFSNVSWLTREP